MGREKYQGTRVQRNRAVVRAQLPAPCTKCGGVVTDQMRWHADHIVSRWEAEQAGWTQQQIDSPTNLGACHGSCNEKDGARLGNKARARDAQARRITPIRREIRFSGDALTVSGVAPQKPSPTGGSAS